jgi:prolyl oligopeptidase
MATSMTNSYPSTRSGAATTILAGESFPDPYRWLEDDTEEVRLWQRAQAELASGYVREWPHFDRLQALVARFSTGKWVALPRYAAGQWFRMHTPPGAKDVAAVVSDDPTGEGRVVFDPRSENRDRPPFLSWISPSPDGRVLAVGVCPDGSEGNTIRLVDASTGRILDSPPPHMLRDNLMGGVSWLADSSGFFFNALTGADDLEQGVYLHRRGPNPTTTLADVQWTTTSDYRFVFVSRDGQYAIALERMNQPIPVAYARLGEQSVRWQPFVTSVAGAVAGHVVGDSYIAVTDVGGSRGRLVAIPLDSVDPNDVDSWHVLVGESDAVLQSVTPVGDRLYLTELVDTYARLRIVDFDGNAVGEVPLPERGAIDEMPFRMMHPVTRGHPDEFVFGFSSLTHSLGLYCHVPGEENIRTLKAPSEQLDDTVVEDRWAVSTDGTRIPYHLVRRADVDPGRRQPTLIYAYGGYYLPTSPGFPGALAAFVAAGGVLVHAHLRGGGEFGLDWWLGGCLRNTQNSYDDLYAIAEDLIAAGICTSQTLGVTGASHGGLMCGVAVTQRPDLWAVATPYFPHFDLIGGAVRDEYGRWLTPLATADIEDPAEVRRLATFSPYQIVRDGVHYPAVFITAGDTDRRCTPWHARKFAARLQAATAGDAPTLVHVWENAGHGMATDENTTIVQDTESLAFTLRHLSVELPAQDGEFTKDLH